MAVLVWLSHRLKIATVFDTVIQIQYMTAIRGIYYCPGTHVHMYNEVFTGFSVPLVIRRSKIAKTDKTFQQPVHINDDSSG